MADLLHDTQIIPTGPTYYARIGAALFPIPAGAKNPTGIVASFALDCSTDPAQWAAWAAAYPGCNWGVVAGRSHLIIVDIDTKDGRDAAWALWCDLCASWGVVPFMPQVESARGGWHCYFRVPEGVDAASLRQPDAIKKLINIRAGNGYTVAAGSFYDGTSKGEASGPYTLLVDAAPYPAPDALVKHCTRSTATRPNSNAAVIGKRDAGDVAGLLRWLNDKQQFDSYEDWCAIGMALKLEFGDAGLDLWRIVTWGEVEDSAMYSKWESFSSEPGASSVTLNTFLKRAHDAGWRGSVGKSAAAMFSSVAQMAANAGVTQSPSGNGHITGMPMLAGQQVLTDLGRPILQDFLDSTADAPHRPLATDYPTLPESCSGHGLYALLRLAIDRIIALAETPRGWKASRIIKSAAVLSLVHLEAYRSVVRRLQHMGVSVPESKIRLATTDLEDRVQRAFVTQDAWIYDTRGVIEHNNSDNVVVFLGIIGCELRWNGWLDRAEIRGSDWLEWTYIDDAIVAKLRTRGNRTKTRFLPPKEFFWESLVALAQARPVDPALDLLLTLQKEWDGTPRLLTWLSRACCVPCDPYHQAVGRNIIGGIVKRIRNAGCKHDTMPVFYGRQGTGKSTLAAILADMGQSSLSAILLNSGKWFTDNVLLGDASKELVLSLAGRSVVEIGEMGMRGNVNANHVKAMISRQVDLGRTAYARSVSERPRRNIFIGTTNDDEPLSDPTGNRRFLPIQAASEIDLVWLHAHVGKLIGEAAHLEAQGANFNLPREVWSIAAEHQEIARSESDIETVFSECFAEMAQTTTAYVTAADLVGLCRMSELRGNNAGRSAIMKRLGFRQEKPYIGGKQIRVWFRGPHILPKHIEREAVRYVIGKDSSGMPRVTIRQRS